MLRKGPWLILTLSNMKLTSPQPIPHYLATVKAVASFLIERKGNSFRSCYIAQEDGRPRRQVFLDNPEVQLEPLVQEHLRDGYSSFALITRAEAAYNPDPKQEEERIPTVLVMYADSTHGEYHCWATIIRNNSVGDWKLMKLGDDLKSQMRLLPILEGKSHGRTPVSEREGV